MDIKVEKVKKGRTHEGKERGVISRVGMHIAWLAVGWIMI